MFYFRNRSGHKRAGCSEAGIRQTTKTSFKDGSGCVKEITRSRSRLQIHWMWSK